jgi:lipopolysaccharide export LptBFGC system permease protein LptF
MSHLVRVLIAPEAYPASEVLEASDAELIGFGGQGVSYERVPKVRLGASDFGSLYGAAGRPGEFDSRALSAYIKALKAQGVNVQPLAVALEKKRAAPFLPLVMVTVGAPLAFVFGRRGTLLALCVTIGAGLLFLGLMNFLQELGARGLLSPPVAAWSPSLLFLAGGIYLLSRSQT